MLQTRLTAIQLAAILSLLAGCANSATIAERFPYHGWPNAFRLSNGTVEVVIVPAIGRIVRYGYIGGENLLRENPALEGKTTSPDPGHWANFGGERVLPWPQRDWTVKFGRDWPPPAAFESLVYQAEVIDDHSLRMVSPPVEPFNFRVVREIHLAEHGTRLTTITRFQQVLPTHWVKPVAVWSIAQWNKPDEMLVHVNDFDDMTVPMIGRFHSITHITPGVLRIRADSASAKAGFNASELAMRAGQYLIIQYTQGWAPPAQWIPGDRAQVYCNKVSANPQPSYVELEFTSPLEQMKTGEQISLEVDWELRRLAPAQRTPSELARIISEQ